VQVGQPTEEEVKDWAWHSDVRSVADNVLLAVGGKDITFVFSLTVPGCEVKEACGIVPPGQCRRAQGGRCASTQLSQRPPLLSCLPDDAIWTYRCLQQSGH
jgi:hypothetical protein